MSTRILTKSAALVAKTLAEYYSEKKIAIISHRTIHEKAMIKLLTNAEEYVLAKTPANANLGVAEEQFLNVIVGNLLQHWFLLKDRDTEYKTGVMTASIASRGLDFAQAAKVLGIVTTKAAVNNHVDAAAGLLVSSPNVAKPDFSQVTRDFIYSVLTDKKFRVSKLNQILHDFVMPHPMALNLNDVSELSARISLGRGEALSPDQVPLHNLLRGLVLAILKEMTDWGIANDRQDVFFDVLSTLSLFIMYTNISENDAVYDTAFPPMAMSGANPLIHGMKVKAFKQMAMMYSKVGFAGKAFNGLMTADLLEDVFKLFPDMFELEVYEASANGLIDFSQISYIKESSSRFNTARSTFEMVLPSMYKGYVSDVIAELKAQTGADILIPTVFDEITGQGTGQQIFKDLTLQYLGAPGDKGSGKRIIIANPEAAAENPIVSKELVKVRDIQKFLLTNVFVAVDTLYKASVGLQSAYDDVFKNLGTPTGGLIQGVSVELELLKSPITTVTPVMNDITAMKHAKLNETYSAPFVMPALAINRSDNSQVYVLSDLKYKIFRPDLLALKFARDGEITGLPVNANLTMFDGLNPHERWSWLPGSIPTPTHMNDASFAHTLLPFNYTFDTVFDHISNSGLKVDRMMTRSGKIPSFSYMTYGETICAFANAGTINLRDMALSLGGSGFLYVRNQKTSKWEQIGPEIPTIYGMPTLFMMDINKVNVDQMLVTKQGVSFLADEDKVPDVKRVIYDRSNKERGVGDAILVLHKYVPSTKPLRFMLGTVRNGFTLKIPYIASIYTQLIDRSRDLIRIAFDEKRDLVEKAITTGGAIPMMDIAQSFNKVLTVFFTQPGTGAGITAEEYFSDFFSKQQAGTKFATYESFKIFYFEEVKGWSNVIAGYPHLSMTNRFTENYRTHFDQWLRQYTSKIYLDVNHLKSREELSVITITPNEMQMLDLGDEETFMASGINALSEISTVSLKNTSEVARTNATLPDEVNVLSDQIQKIASKGEGFEMQAFGAGDVKGTKTVPNITETLTKSATIEGETANKYQLEKKKGRDGDGNELNIDTDEQVLKRNANKEADFKTMNPNVETFNEQGELDAEGKTTAQALDLSLDKDKISKTFKQFGKGDVEGEDKSDDDLSPEEKAKEAKKRRNKSSDNEAK